MPTQNAAATALATVGTVLWCIQLIPQIYHNWKRKDCTGLPPHMMFLWVISGIPFAIFFLILDTNIILQIQPHLFTFFCGVGFVQSCYYPPVSMNKKKIIAITLGIIAFDIGAEIGFVLWLRPLYARGIEWPAMIFGIIASVLLAVGLLPPYFELAKRQGQVVGINFVFIALDSLGAYFSIASVCVGDMDILSIVLYAVIAVLELGIVISHVIWLCRFKWFGNDSKTGVQSDGSETDGTEVDVYMDGVTEIGTEKIKDTDIVSTYELDLEESEGSGSETHTKQSPSALFQTVTRGNSETVKGV